MTVRLKILWALLVIVFVVACSREGMPTRRPLNLYPTPTVAATQTPIYMEVEVPVTQVVEKKIVVEVTPTPQATGRLCVSATVAVYLRPSPSDDNYPIMPLPNSSVLTDLGGRDGDWLFVQFSDKTGWVNGSYVGACR
jgi:hypothetical protein